MELIHPNIKFKVQLTDYINAFKKNNEAIHGSSDVDKFDTIQQWIDYCTLCSQIETCPMDRVQAYQFLFIDDNGVDLIGMINCRLALNDYLRQKGGHIGYSIHPKFRERGLAKLQLKYALELYKHLNFERVLITCYKDNIASAKVIQSVGGKLEDEFFESDTNIIQRYWVEL